MILTRLFVYFSLKREFITFTEYFPGEIEVNKKKR